MKTKTLSDEDFIKVELIIVESKIKELQKEKKRLTKELKKVTMARVKETA